MGLISKVFALSILAFLIVAVYIFYQAYPDVFHDLLNKVQSGTSSLKSSTPDTALLVTKMTPYFVDKGITLKGADVNGETLRMRLSVNVIPSSLLDSAAEDIYKVNDSLKDDPLLNSKVLRITMQYYYGDEPLFEMSTLREYLVDENMFLRNVELKDLRSTPFKIETDLWVFDYTIDSVDVTDDAVNLRVIPDSNDIHEAMNDLVNMAFVALEDAPFAEHVNIAVVLDSDTINFNFASQDLLSYMNGDMDFETLMSHATSS